MNYEVIRSDTTREVTLPSATKKLSETPLLPSKKSIEKILNSFQIKPASETKDFYLNGLGGLVHKKFFSGFAWPSQQATLDHFQPSLGEDFFDWLEVLGSVLEDPQDFSMIELGCGFGRWLGVATTALKQLGQVPVALLGVEAEPTRFRWAREHLLTNGVSKEKIFLVKGTVGNPSRKLYFTVGNPSSWYGQSLTHQVPLRKSILRDLFKKFRSAEDPLHLEALKNVSVGALIHERQKISFLHMDVQGAEVNSIEEAKQMLNERVAKVHIRTHGAAIENSLRKIFNQLRWAPVWDFPSCATSETPMGKIAFSDGVQTWVNPRF